MKANVRKHLPRCLDEPLGPRDAPTKRLKEHGDIGALYGRWRNSLSAGL